MTSISLFSSSVTFEFCHDQSIAIILQFAQGLSHLRQLTHVGASGYMPVWPNLALDFYVALARSFYFRNVRPFSFSKDSPNLGNQI